MLTKIIIWSLDHRLAVAAASSGDRHSRLLLASALTIDAFPDTTPVQVQVNTDVPGLVATEVERLVTFPIELSLGGLPGLIDVRSISQFGLSQVTATFDDGTDIYQARLLIAQRLANVEMPDGVPRPELGPVATGPRRSAALWVIAAGRRIDQRIDRPPHAARLGDSSRVTNDSGHGRNQHLGRPEKAV